MRPNVARLQSVDDADDLKRAYPLIGIALPGLIVGILTALHHLTRPALWYDEASSLGAIHGLGATIRQSGATMATYYAVLRVWALVSENPIWLRMLSLVLALLALVFTVQLARRWLNDQWAAWTGVFLAMSYLWGDQAAEARAYPMAMLLVVLSWSVLEQIVVAGDERTDDVGQGNGSGWRLSLTYLVLWLLLPPTHGLTIFFLGAQLATLLLAGPGRRTWILAMPGIVTAVTTTVALWSMGAAGVTDWVAPFTRYAATRLVLTQTGPILLIAIPMLTLIALGIRQAIAQARVARTGADRFRPLAPALWAGAPMTALLLISLVHPLLVPRYLVFAAPGVAILLAMGARAVGALVAPTRQRLAVGVGISVVIFGLLCAQIAIVQFPEDRWDQVVNLLQTESRPGDALILPERRNRGPLEAAWTEGAPPKFELVDFDRPLGRVSYIEPTRPLDTALANMAGHERVWLIYQVVFGPSGQNLRRVENSPELKGNFRLAASWKIDRDIVVRRYDRRN